MSFIDIFQRLKDKWRLQQDNDPKHTCHLAKNFLWNNMPEVIDWPSNSPDLNPIEISGVLLKEMWRRKS